MPTWTLIPGSSPTGAVTTTPTLPPLYPAMTQQDFLDLFDRLFPENYLASLKSPGPGYELFQAFGKVAARLSTALGNVETCAVSLTAPSGVRATATVQFTRNAAPYAPLVTLKGGSYGQGTIVTTSRGDRRFALVADVVLPANGGDPVVQTVSATVAAQAYGYEWNVPGPITLPNGTTWPGMIDTIYLLALTDADGNPTVDPTITVAQTADATGGAPPALDQHGADKGIPRQAGEPDSTYRARIRMLPDTVSPDAIKRSLLATFTPYGASAYFVEAFGMSGFLPDVDTPTPTGAIGVYDPTTFFYDDTRSTDPAEGGVPLRNRWVDDGTSLGAFIAIVPYLAAITDLGWYYDDTAAQVSDTVSPGTGGKRAMPYFDIPGDAIAGLLAGYYDAWDLGRAAIYRNLQGTLDAIKPGGVTAEMDLVGQ